MSDRHEEMFLALSRDRFLAHQSLFAHRHKDATPKFHRTLINDWHGPRQHICEMVFRGGGKSSIAEEGFLINAGYQEFRNGIIVGNVFDRAAERLAAIRHEVETNEALEALFGNLKGSTWSDDELVFSNGIRILAMGRGQSIRGIKFNDERPDFWFWDDIENEESVRTEDGRRKTLQWALKEFLPACAPSHKGRMAATPLDPDDLPNMLARGGAEGTGWFIRKIPWVTGSGPDRKAMWPERFPLSYIDREEARFASVGMIRQYRMEYLVEAEHPEEKPFRAEQFRIVPSVRTWQNVYGMFDPARTVKATSAMTGFASWSWVGNKLVVWDSWGRMLLPDAIVKEILDFGENEALHPALIGVEEDGLNEFLMQPLRHEMTKRRILLPLRAMKAPAGKDNFIRGLQPFFNAREVEFAHDMPELKKQLLSFPSGRKDVPNALAYALLMRPGAPVYDSFSGRHVAEDLVPLRGRNAYLAVNATRASVSAVLVQHFDGAVRIYADWLREGEPAAVVRDILQDANLLAGHKVHVIAGPKHFDQYNNVGLMQAIRQIPFEIQKSVEPERGRPFIRKLLEQEIQGMPALMVNDRASWTLNGFAGGYARVLQKQGMLADFAEEGPYRTLMEGLESFIGLMNIGRLEEDKDDEANRFATNSRGIRYRTAMGNR